MEIRNMTSDSYIWMSQEKLEIYYCNQLWNISC